MGSEPSHVEIDNINDELNKLASGYIRVYTAKKDTNDIPQMINYLIIQYYSTLSYSSCYDITFDGITISEENITSFFVKLATKRYGINWHNEIIKTFDELSEIKSCKTRHFKLYLSLMIDLLTYFMDKVNTVNVITLINYFKKLILNNTYYEGKECHIICSKFVSEMLRLHAYTLPLSERTDFFANVFVVNSELPLFTYVNLIKYINISESVFSEIVCILFNCKSFTISCKRILKLLTCNDYKRAIALNFILKLLQFNNSDILQNGTQLISVILNILRLEYKNGNMDDTQVMMELGFDARMVTWDNIDYSFECVAELLSRFDGSVQQNVFEEISAFILGNDSCIYKTKRACFGKYFAWQILDEYFRIVLESAMKEGVCMEVSQETMDKLVISIERCLKCMIFQDYKPACKMLKGYFVEYIESVQNQCKRWFIVGISVSLKMKRVAQLNGLRMTKINEYMTKVKKTKVFKELGLLKDIQW